MAVEIQFSVHNERNYFKQFFHTLASSPTNTSISSLTISQHQATQQHRHSQSTLRVLTHYQNP